MMHLFILFFCLWYTSVYAQNGIRIIYVIHGDGNYLFHDNEGRALNAAGEILEQSISVGENLKNGEVFIFHQKPSGNFLFVRLDDGEFFHYRNGLKMFSQTYSRKHSPVFEPEAELIQKYAESSKNFINMLLFYGHEIPQENETGYYYSDPETEFGIPIFAEGIKNFLNSLSKKKFDLIVLSTCRNGNHKTAELLSPSAKYLVASPADIHLSYMNSESLISLNVLNQVNEKELAVKFAENAYNTMCEAAKTEISISVYDLNKKFFNKKDIPGEAVINFYRPPLFGRKLSLKQK